MFRSRFAGAALALTVAALGLVVPAASATAAHVSAPKASKPVWVPMHVAFGLDCAGDNPGCTSNRDFYSVDIVPTGQFGDKGRPSHVGVFAMGAGTVHIGNAHGTSCGSTSKGSFGTWVWIDHGHGVKSRYGHLNRILVRNGQHVAAGEAIGTVGATGKAKHCNVHYLDFMVEHGKLSDDSAYRFRTLQACTTGGVQQTWPTEATTTKAPGNRRRVHFTTWGSTAHGTQFPASSTLCIP